MRTTIVLLSMVLSICSKAKSKPDTSAFILLGKTLYTVDSAFHQAEGVVIRNGKVIFVGTQTDILANYPAKTIIDIPGIIYPGFIDAHCHFSGYALDAYKCDLVGTTSFADVLEKLKAYKQVNKYPWIYGRGWDQNDWAIKEYPTKEALDTLFPDKPVILKRIDGHAVLCNQKALDMAGIDLSTEIEGGMIEKKNGKLTGILVDNAAAPVENPIRDLPVEDAIEYLKKAEYTCFANGLTGVVDCGVTEDKIRLLQRLYKKNILTIGNSTLLSQDDKTLDAYLKKRPFRAGQFQVNGIKLYADGALGSRGACLLRDYSDRPGQKGMLLSSYEAMNNVAAKAKKYNWQLCTHAIGDSANRAILDMYGFHLLGKNDLRWRIEHAQIVDKHDLIKFSLYSVVPSVQPTHAISDMPWAETRLGKNRISEAYSNYELKQQNGWIALGTDFPVEEISPIATFYTAVVRKDASGFPANGFLKENALSREDALRGMTIWAAKSVFLEKEKGSIEKGKDADIVVLDTDIITADEKDILKAKVLMTIVKGTIVYRNEKGGY